MKKKAPYSEIINLGKELKEYKKLCKGKGKKFIYYLDWKEYIIKEINKLDSDDKLENFKHYLLNSKRVYKNMNTYYVTLMVFVITTLLNKLDIEYSTVMLYIIIYIIFFQILIENDNNNKDYCFYCDLIEIIEEIQKERRE